LVCSLPVFIFFLSCFPALAGKRPTAPTEFDRVAYAVEGAESSHGSNPAMWRTDPAGPQGPMQVSEKAAIDIGGGDRLDIEQNRTMGRAYLSLLYTRYGNWVDAISAYNWGMGRVDGWIRQGRPSTKLLPEVAAYLRRVLHDSGLPEATTAVSYRASFVALGPRHDGMFLPILQNSGLPLAPLASSGTPLPALEQSGRPLPVLRKSGRRLVTRLSTEYTR
jgi:hypothetical protein